MGLFVEAGLFAWVGFVVLLSALVCAIVRPADGVRLARRAALAVIALGMLGTALGQRLVDRAVLAEPVLEQKVLLLSMGTRETSANLLLSGLYALALLGVARAIEARARRGG
jgi:hypothetical protein